MTCCLLMRRGRLGSFSSYELAQYAGGSPAATHFSCFAKKSKQKKATAKPLPFGFPFVHDKKWEANETRYAQTTFTS